MRRIAALLLFAALVAGLTACSADAPSPSGPKQNGGGSNALQVALFTNSANPTAGLCSTIQATVTLNGAPVPDGTGVSFSTNLGVFEQNGQTLVSVVTQGGSAVTAVCSNFVGVAKVRATATVSGATNSATISISFQPSAQSVPFFSFCSPNNGPNTGGTLLTINGGLFFGDASSTRVQFTSMGVTRQGVVQNVTSSAVTVLTPAFPEAVSPSVPVDVTITFGTNTSAPLTISAPSCFVYGTTLGDQPTITAVLPSTGSNDGGTRVTIIGSGFIAPVQVFFGVVEAPPPTSVTYNQIIVQSPPATPQSGQVNASVGIKVLNVNSGKASPVLAGGFTYVTALQLTGFNGPNLQAWSSVTFIPLTIIGNGFSAPVGVSLAGYVATVISVSATQVVVMPGPALVSSCSDVTGPIVVTNLNTGDTATGLSFTYLVKETTPVITGVFSSPAPPNSGVGSTVTITGFNLANSIVTFGGITASSTSTPMSISATAPNDGKSPPACGTNPPGTPMVVDTVDIVVTTGGSGCTTTAKAAFIYYLPCQ